MGSAEEWIHWLFSSTAANIISFGTGLVGIALAIYYAGRNPVSKRVFYRTKGANIVNKKNKDIPRLQIQFDSADITVLTETTIHFWNAGNASIGASDSPAAAPPAGTVPIARMRKQL